MEKFADETFIKFSKENTQSPTPGEEQPHTGSQLAGKQLGRKGKKKNQKHNWAVLRDTTLTLRQQCAVVAKEANDLLDCIMQTVAESPGRVILSL